MADLIEIRRLSGDDAQMLAACAELSLRCFPAASGQQWGVEQLKSHLVANDNAIFAAVKQGRLRAFAVIAILDGQGDLLSICSDPDQRREGFAKAVMDDVLARLQLEQVTLEVAAGNLAAISLYERLGFAEIGRRDSYYPAEHGGRDDALMMRLLCQL
ncbi:MAG: GNAT family N-acetyltransferase [Alphaproteobacteria bacterium]